MVLRVCCLEGNGPTHSGRRTLLLTLTCAPGCHGWARLSSWMWAGSSSTPMEPSALRTCLTSFTLLQQVTTLWPSPSVTCCCRFLRRRQRRDEHRWFEGYGHEAHFSRGMSHLLLLQWLRHAPGTWRRKGSRSGGWRNLMWVGPRGVWDHILEQRVGCGRGGDAGERPHYRRRHCDCSSNVKRIHQVRATLNFRLDLMRSRGTAVARAHKLILARG